MKEFETFAELAASKQTKVGTRFVCRERANAEYILQASGYTALAGDVTFANGLIGELQRSSEGWNFLHFGVADGATGDENSDAFELAIVRAGSSCIVGNGGTYRQSRPLIFNSDSSGIESLSGIILLVQTTLGGYNVKFAPLTPELGTIIAYPKMSGVRLARASTLTHTDAQGLIIHNVFAGKFDDFYIEGAHNCLEIKGIQATSFSNFSLTSNAAGVVDNLTKSVITYDGYPLTAGGSTNAYTTNFIDFFIYADKSGYSLDIAKADSLIFTNGYFGEARDSHIKIEHARDNEVIGEVKFSDVYFDGVDRTTGSKSHLKIPVVANPTRFIIDVRYDNCNINNFNEDVVVVQGKVQGLFFNNTNISNCNGWGIVSTATAGDIFISGSSGVNGANKGGGKGSISIGASDNFKCSDSYFRFSTGGIVTANTKYVTITDNHFFGTTGEINVSGQVRKTVNGNVSSLGIITADDLSATSFTPTLSIGGSSTGITYTKQTGYAQKTGNFVYFNVEVTLSNKGAETGNVIIGSLPFASTVGASASIAVQNMATGVGETHLQCQLLSGGVALFPRKMLASGLLSPLTNTDINNSAEFVISGVYYAGV